MQEQRHMHAHAEAHGNAVKLVRKYTLITVILNDLMQVYAIEEQIFSLP